MTHSIDLKNNRQDTSPIRIGNYAFVVADVLRKADCPVSEEVNIFVTDALFCTITNANFDDESILKRVDKGITMRNGLIQEAKHNKSALTQSR